MNLTWVLKTTLKSICILDGDKNVEGLLDDRIISLPGNGSPEQIVFQHLITLYDDSTTTDSFWLQHQVTMEGYSFSWVQEKLIQKVKHESKNYERKRAKKLFYEHKDFFILVFRHWLLQNRETKEYKSFLWYLNVVFKKTATENSINPNIWNKNIKPG